MPRPVVHRAVEVVIAGLKVRFESDALIGGMFGANCLIPSPFRGVRDATVVYDPEYTRFGLLQGDLKRV